MTFWGLHNIRFVTGHWISLVDNCATKSCNFCSFLCCLPLFILKTLKVGFKMCEHKILFKLYSVLVYNVDKLQQFYQHFLISILSTFSYFLSTFFLFIYICVEESNAEIRYKCKPSTTLAIPILCYSAAIEIIRTPYI